jgi:tetratricopeptide (TPR) repeat protein
LPSPNLLTIVAYARAGALDRAWALFREQGLEAVDDDPAVLSVKGRLLKDRDAFADAARAYGRAAELGGGAYPRINAATLWRLAGDPGRSAAEARAVLADLDADPDAAETPYWREATRAEALLLLGRTADARAALETAIGLAPRAWEDHAVTLRQFARVLAAGGEDAGWLDPLRPPRALHFAGRMSLAEGEAGRLAAETGRLVDEARIGFAFGALAAGADIVIAEVLVGRGVELEVVLPAAPEAFRAASVVPGGADWGARFDALIAQAASVRVVGAAAEPAHPLAVELAAEVAMGCAARWAGSLATEAVQLVALDPASPGATGWMQQHWARSGRRQLSLDLPGLKSAALSPRGRDDLELVAMLAADFSEVSEAEFRDQVLPALALTAGVWSAAVAAPIWQGRRLSAVFADPSAATRAALTTARATGRSRAAVHYGLATPVEDPFGGPRLWLGEDAELGARLLEATPPGGLYLSDYAACALHARGLPPGWRTELVGELDSTEIHALKA